MLDAPRWVLARCVCARMWVRCTRCTLAARAQGRMMHARPHLAHSGARSAVPCKSCLLYTSDAADDM
eukprot:12629973-Alexandrium_andersonii.AAC.1